MTDSAGVMSRVIEGMVLVRAGATKFNGKYVKTNNNTTTVRVGQTNAIKVVASNQSAAVGTIDKSNVGDVNTGARANNNNV